MRRFWNPDIAGADDVTTVGEEPLPKSTPPPIALYPAGQSTTVLPKPPFATMLTLATTVTGVAFALTASLSALSFAFISLDEIVVPEVKSEKVTAAMT